MAEDGKEIDGPISRKIEAVRKAYLMSGLSPERPTKLPKDKSIMGRLEGLQARLQEITRGPIVVTTETLFENVGIKMRFLNYKMDIDVTGKKLMKMFNIVRRGHGDEAALNFAKTTLEFPNLWPSKYFEEVKALEKREWKNSHDEAYEQRKNEAIQIRRVDYRGRDNTKEAQDQFKILLANRGIVVPTNTS